MIVRLLGSCYPPSEALRPASHTLIGAAKPAPANDGSRVPLTVRHDDATVQVPTTLPPQAVTSGQDAPPPPAPVAPVPELPPVPGVPPEPELHPSEEMPAAIANASAAVPSFIRTIGVVRIALLTNRRAEPMLPTLRCGPPRRAHHLRQEITLTKARAPRQIRTWCRTPASSSGTNGVVMVREDAEVFQLQ